MLTESELTQMTLVVRDRLDNEELDSLGQELGHLVRVVDSYFDCDSREGQLECECGWRPKWMKSCWFAQHVQEHLDEVIAKRFDVDGSERD